MHYYNNTHLAYNGDLSEQKEPLDGIWGIIGKSGNELTPIIYSSITLFGSNGYVVENNNKFGLLDSKAKEITPIIYSEIKELDQGYSKVLQKNRWGIIDSLGNEIIACENLFVSSLNDTIFYVYSKDKLYAANLKGEYVQELFFGKTETIDKRLMRIFVSEVYYDYYNSFEEDYGTTLYGIADTSENEIIQCIYDEIYVFENSFAVKTNDKWFYLDKNGKRINQVSYDDITKLNDRMAIYTIIEPVDGDNELHYGYINAYGKRLTKYVFKYAEDFIDGKAKVSIDGEEYFFIDEKGKTIK